LPNSPYLPPPARIVIASRESALAMWQAEHVRDLLAALYPSTAFTILGMTTQGDQILDKTLSKIGGKGLFVKELETALLEGRADMAVHSMKDVPMQLGPEFRLAAIMTREDPRDAFVSNHYRALAELPPGAVVGTSSLRREAQIRARFPHLAIEPLRGNVGTRLRKLDEGRYAAIILAAAGLKRLGLAARIAALIGPDESLPAVGQGALGLECLAARDDVARLLAALDDAATSACVRAERAMSVRLSGSCQTPLGGFAEVADGMLDLRGFVAMPDGSRMLRAEARGALNAPEALGASVGDQLLAQGAAEILRSLA
jgi:hydroxymethylbilane synthase